jgi:hypothetical protein
MARLLTAASHKALRFGKNLARNGDGQIGRLVDAHRFAGTRPLTLEFGTPCNGSQAPLEFSQASGNLLRFSSIKAT